MFKINGYQEFIKINEELPFHDEFTDILQDLVSRENNVALALLNLASLDDDVLKNNSDYIALADDIGQLSFLASNRVDTGIGYSIFHNNRRQSVRTGRLVRSIISDIPK